MSTTTKYLLGLLSSIVVTSCVSQSSYDSLEAENAVLREQSARDKQELAAQQTRNAKLEKRATKLEGAIGYTVNSDLLFEPGSWKMSARGKDIISKMADKLAPTQENTLVVNGYTDDQPIGPKLEKQGVDTNQELSQKRAEAVREHLISRGADPSKVIAVGHGDANPIGDNDTAKGRSQNRRVELTLGG